MPVAQRLDAEAEAHSGFLSGCPATGEPARAGKPLVVGIDGGYVRDRDDKSVILKLLPGSLFFSVGAPADTRRFGFVQKDDCHPERRLMTHLSAQGMQANQQIFFCPTARIISGTSSSVCTLSQRMCWTGFISP